MKVSAFLVMVVSGAICLSGGPASAVTIFHESETNDSRETANFIEHHDGSIDIFGHQDASFDVFSFYGTAGDTVVLEVQNEDVDKRFSDFDSVMNFYNPVGHSWYDDDDDTNIDDFGNDLPQRVRDMYGSYISRTLTHTGLFHVALENFCLCDEQTYQYKLVVRGLTPTGAQPSVVPLPAGLPLLLTGMGLMVMLRRGRGPRR